MESRQQAIAASLLCFLAAACVTTNSTFTGQQPDQAAFVARKAAAEKLTNRGDLAEAVVQWKILETLAGHDPELTRKRRSVEAEANRRAQTHFDKGTEALAKRRPKTARREFLTVLALDPTHREAIEQLRRLEVKKIRRDRPKIASPMPRPANGKKSAAIAKAPPPTKKVSNEKASAKNAPKPQPGPQQNEAPTSESLDRAVDLAKQGAYLASIPFFRSHLSQFPADDEATGLLANSHREVGITLYNHGKLEESLSHLEASADYGDRDDGVVEAALSDAKSRLAQEAYEKGVRVFRQDVEMAIALWEQTLAYDPGHVKAKSYLDRAYKIQQSLNSLAQ
jgi:tetratricopeptide (TPR) repeat protein